MSEVVSALRRTWWVVAVVTAIFVVAASILLSRPPQYVSTATLAALQGQAPTIVRLAMSEGVLDAVAGSVGSTTEDVRGSVAVSTPTQTNLVVVTAFSETPGGAQGLADATAEAVIAEAATLNSSGEAQPPAVTILEAADLPEEPVGADEATILSTAVALGLASGVFAGLAVDRMRRRVSSARAAGAAGIPIIAAFDAKTIGAMLPDPAATRELALRVVRENEAADPWRCRIVPVDVGSHGLLVTLALALGIAQDQTEVTIVREATSTRLAEFAKIDQVADAVASADVVLRVTEDRSGSTMMLARSPADRLARDVAAHVPGATKRAALSYGSDVVGAAHAAVLLIPHRRCDAQRLDRIVDELSADDIEIRGVILVG